MEGIVDRLRAPHVDPVMMCSEMDKLYVYSVFVVLKKGAYLHSIESISCSSHFLLKPNSSDYSHRSRL